jgi:hypothetical protein
MLGSKKKPQQNQTAPLNSTQTASMKLNSESLDKAIHCMNKLTEMASNLNRNIILDQVCRKGQFNFNSLEPFTTCHCFLENNVYVSTRRRKMALFSGFQRKAFVLVQADEVYNERMKKIETEENKEAFISMIQNMKG